jgi:fibronectin-binding autotransporter adhesin
MDKNFPVFSVQVYSTVWLAVRHTSVRPLVVTIVPCVSETHNPSQPNVNPMKLRKSTPFRSSPFLAVAFSATVFCHIAASSASAQALYWDNDGATPGFGAAAGTWAAPTTGNGTQGWSSDATGATFPTDVTTTTGNTLNFGTSAAALAAGTITVSGTVDANKIVFAASTSGPFTLSGGTIALGGTSPSITNNRGGQTITSALTLNANTSIVTATSGTAITLNGAIGGPSNLTLTTANVNLGGSNTFFFLGAASNYAGSTIITTANVNNNLTVRSEINNALPTTTVLALNGGNGPTSSTRIVTFDLNNRDQKIAGLTNTPATNRAQRVLTGTGTSLLTIENTSPASSTFSGNINGAGMSLAKAGTGTQILSSTNSYTGNTNISGGKLQGVVGGNCAASKVIISNTLGTFGIAVTDNTKTWTCKDLAPTAAGMIEFNFGAVTPSTSLSPLTITDPALVTGVADFTAATPKIQVNVDAGLLPGVYPLMTWDTVSGTIPTTADLTVSNIAGGTAASLSVTGNTLNLVIASTAASVVKANNTNNLNLGTSWVGGTAPDSTKIAIWNDTVTAANTTVLGADATWAGISILNPNGLVTINGSNTLTLGAAAIDIDLGTATADMALNCPLALSDSNAWNVAATRSLTLGGQVSGAFGIDKLGDGTAILSSGLNSYSGNTSVSAGALKLGANNVIPNGIGNGNVSVAATLDLNGKSDTVNGLSGAGIIDNTLAATSPVLTVGANDQTSTFGGVIQNTTGSVNLVKTGTGTLVLGAANTLSGSVTVNGGTLGYTNTAPLDNASGIALAGGTTLRSEVNGATLAPPITVGVADTIARITAPISAGSGTTLFPVTINSPITGAGDVTFIGLNSTNSYGMIVLNAPCDYAGDTVMTCSNELATPSTLGNNNIFVRLGVENALPATTVLKLDGGGGAGSGRFCELNLFGNNQTLAGLTNVTGNALRSQEIYNTSGTLATLTVNNTDSFVYSGKLGGQIGFTATSGDNLALTKSGAGTFTISGANTYTGATTISGGTLALGALGTLPNASAVSIGAGTLNAATTGTETTGTLAVTGAATISLAAGAQLVFADSSAGGTATWAGTLSIGGFVSGSSLNFGSSSGLTAQQLSKISATGFTNFGLDAEGDLTADPASGGTFADWLLANAPATGFVTDTDKDGLANGVENVLGSNPNAYNAGLTEVSSTATSVIFKHTLNPTIASDVTYGYEWSTDLTEWKTTGQTNTGGTTATIIPSAPALGVVTVTVTITGGPPAKLFGRLAARN